MYNGQPKKLLIINILDILRRYSDADHRLSQSDILAKLKSEYGMDVNRKSVKSNIMDLIDFGYDIEYTVSERSNGADVYSDFYLNREFNDEELRTLIDSLLFSKYIPYNQCKELVKKLEALSSIYFKYKVRHVTSLPEKYPKTGQLFYIISVLDEAIEKKVKVKFKYRDFGVDKKLKNRKDSDGKDKIYTVSPYQMAATNSRYYLICNSENHENISHFRLDKIADITMTDEKSVPAKKIKGYEKGFDLPRHMAEHIYMFSGKSEAVVFRTSKNMITQAIDWFGTDISLFNITQDSVDIKVTVNLQAMHYWAMQYANHVKVISPQSLADSIKADLKAAYEKYR